MTLNNQDLDLRELYRRALLADIVYRLDAKDYAGSGGDDLFRGDIAERMTAVVAENIVNEFDFVAGIETSDVAGSGFDASVFRDASGKIFVCMQGTQGLQDFLSDKAPPTVTRCQRSCTPGRTFWRWASSICSSRKVRLLPCWRHR